MIFADMLSCSVAHTDGASMPTMQSRVVALRQAAREKGIVSRPPPQDDGDVHAAARPVFNRDRRLHRIRIMGDRACLASDLIRTPGEHVVKSCEPKRRTALECVPRASIAGGTARAGPRHVTRPYAARPIRNVRMAETCVFA